MHYYDVLVATKNKHFGMFTYASSQKMIRGMVVIAPFRSKRCQGVVWGPSEPHPKANQIEDTGYTVPLELLEASINLADISASSYSGVASLILSSYSPSKSRLSPPGKPTDEPAPLVELTKDQSSVLNDIRESGPGQPVLLHGVTGSGKTRVYQELIEDTLQNGKSCIVLSPELGLSSQMYARIKDSTRHPVYEINSRQTKAYRSMLWKLISTCNKPIVITGPRSALFMPLSNIGLIVVDEFHDSSYKQDNEPRYMALHMASLLSKAHNATLVCGSATPNIDDYHSFEASGYPILTLDKTAIEGARIPDINVVDLTRSKGSDLLSPEAEARISAAIKRGNQSLLFFNKRGDSRLVQCTSCGWTANCTNCDYRLTLHKDRGSLVCHVCNSNFKPPSVCKECSSPVGYKSPGIKQLEKEVASKFTDVMIYRFDSDQTDDKSLAGSLEDVAKSKSTILIGTQMISKGLDLPLLESVVVIHAESSLSVPDYRSEERYYQQLTQLIGRVGRGHISETNVTIQTYQPDHPILKACVDRDWSSFLHRERQLRKAQNLPPYRYAAAVKVRRKSRETAQKSANRIADTLKGSGPGLTVLGPAPALQEQVAGKYEWIITLLSTKRSALLKVSKQLEGKEIVDLDPLRLF